MSKLCSCSGSTTGVYQSPIELSHELYHVFEIESQSEWDCQSLIKSEYDSQNKQWNVTSEVKVINNGCEYKLIQFHLHQPGEHKVDGKTYPIEIHFVFESTGTQNPSMFVIGYLAKLNLKSSRLFRHLVSNKEFHLPNFKQHYTYAGSLTTPPFEINVNWNVVANILYITEKDLGQLKSKSKSARPIQSRNGRDIILVHNYCDEEGHQGHGEIEIPKN
jgi:carbonic anhydrase